MHSLDLPPNQLRTFLAVARRLSFTRAAEELHLTQPAVSMHVRKLERANVGADPQRVIDLLQGTAAAHPLVEKVPAPEAVVVSFTPGAMNVELRAWTEQPDEWTRVRSDLAIAVNQALAAANTEIAARADALQRAEQQLVVYARDLEPFERILRQAGVERDDRLKLITEGEHLHSTAPRFRLEFEQMCIRMGVGEAVERVNW